MQTLDARPPTIDELTQHFGRSRSTIYEWFRRKCPKTSIEDVETWVRLNVAERDEGGDDSPSVRQQIELERLRKLKAEAEEIELKNAVNRGELLVAADAELAVSELTGMVRTRAEAIPDRIASEMPAEFRDKARQIAANEVYLILTEMSQWRLGS